MSSCKSDHCRMEHVVSIPSRQDLIDWRVFLETAWALNDILDDELQAERGMNLDWYDALVHLEETPEGANMTELADRILASKSGLTRVIDRMEEAGLVRRERPPEDRRVVRVLITPEGVKALDDARSVHRRGVREHYLAHLSRSELASVTAALRKVREHVRPLRPGRISA